MFTIYMLRTDEKMTKKKKKPGLRHLKLCPGQRPT